MGKASFTIAILKPEIASGMYKFASAPDRNPSSLSRQSTSRTNGDSGGLSNSNDPSQDLDPGAEIPQAPLRSSIAGVTAVEAALLYPNGQIFTNLFARIAKAGFIVQKKRMIQLTKAQARSLFGFEAECLKDEKEFRAFLDHFTSGLSMALLLACPESLSSSDAIAKWKALVGPKNPVVARQEALSASLPHDEWPLHALCGLNSIQNGIQSSANLDCFYRERAFLFPYEEGGGTPRLERAVVVVFSGFMTSFPEGKPLLLAKLNAGGVLVVKMVENYRFPSLKELSLVAKELHPVTNEQHRDEFMQCLQQAVGMNDVENGGSCCCCLLEVEALDLSTKIRGILGPASLENARVYFPESVRAEIPQPLASLDHVRTLENETTCLESGIFVSFDPRIVHVLTNHTAKDDEIERTFAIIKPGTASDPFAVREIQSAIHAFGFTIEKERRLLLTRAQAATFYGEHRGKAFFERLLAFMTSGKIVAMQLARKNAILTWRGLMGPTNAIKARETHPWTLRARFGIDGTRNATHGSDARSSARRELKFFFGGGLQAFANGGDTLQEKATHSSKAIAQRALPSPYQPELTLEKLLVLALDEMLGFEVTTQVEACSWLGNWLVEYSQRQLLKQHSEQEQGSSSLTSSYSQPNIFKPGTGATVKMKKQQVAPVDSLELLFGANCTFMVVFYEKDVPLPLRAAVGKALCSLATKNQFLFLDVATALRESESVESLVSRIKVSGKRKFVLHDVDSKSATLLGDFHQQLEWRINFAVTISHNTSNNTNPMVSQITESKTELNPMVPHVYYNLQQQQSLNGLTMDRRFQTFFAEIFSPVLVIVYDPKKLVELAQWSAVAQQFGFKLLAFEDLIQSRIAKERSANGTFTQLRRTRAKIPHELLFALFSDYVNNFQPKSVSDDEAMRCAQKFLICGFPFESEALPAEFEEHVGSVYRLLNVHTEEITTGSKRDDNAAGFGGANAWISHARKRGVVTDLQTDPGASISTDGSDLLSTSCGLSFGPIVGFCVGEERSNKRILQLKSLAQTQGFIWLDVSHFGVGSPESPQQEDTVGILKRVLLRANAGREKIVLYGFPLSKETLLAFMERICMPRFVVITSSLAKSSSSGLQDFVRVLDEFPQIVQLDIAHALETNSSSSSDVTVARLLSVFFGKRVSFLVGDSVDLNRENMQTAVASLGYCVLDLRKQKQQARPPDVGTLTSDPVITNMQVQSIVSQIQATAGPRCIVIGAPEHLSFFQALEARVGSAVDKIVLLKHVERQAPPRASKRDDEGEDYYSDDEEELERQRRLKARAALPKHLDELLQVYGLAKSSSSSGGGASQIVISRVTFLEVSDKVYDHTKSQLMPVVLGVIGNAHTFYASVLSLCAKRHAIALLPSTWWSSGSDAANKGDSMTLDEKTTKFQRFVAETAFAVYFADGFPRTTNNAAPYVTQQLWVLERTVAPMQALVHFTASMDVLVERKLEGVTRNMLEDAQDELDAETSELLAFFGGSPTASTSASSQKRQKVLSVTCERGLADAQKELEEVLLRAGVLR